jgi:hypothetical protein
MKTRTALGQTKAAQSSRRGTAPTTAPSTVDIGAISAPAQPNHPDQFVVFQLRCEARAILVTNHMMSLHQAVDELQRDAERAGLTLRTGGQDMVQRLMSAAFAAVDCCVIAAAADKQDTDLEPHDQRVFEQRIDERVRLWESRDPRDNGSALIDVFRHVIRLGDTRYVQEWLQQHRDHAPALLRLLKETSL